MNEKWQVIPTDLTIRDLWGRANQINLNPHYQRELVWNNSLKKRLIWCILRGQDIPKFYFHWRDESGLEVYDVIDGKQRTDTILAYVNNEFALDIRADDIDGFKVAKSYYKDLPDELRKRFNSYTIQVMNIVTDDHERIIDQFLDLQRGKALNSQEKRQVTDCYIRDVVRILGSHNYFTKYLKKTRRVLRDQVALRVFTWVMSGKITDTTSNVLDKIYISNAQNLLPNELVEDAYLKTVQTLDDLSLILDSNEKRLRRATMTMVLFWIVHQIRYSHMMDVHSIDGLSDTLFHLVEHVDSMKNSKNVDPYLANFSYSANGGSVNQMRFEYLMNIVRRKHALTPRGTKGYVYLAEGLGCHKIGFSQEPPKRMKQIGVVLPEDVVIIHLIPTDCMHMAEKELHTTYKKGHIRGEWFNLTKENIKEIKSVNGLYYNGECA